MLKHPGIYVVWSCCFVSFEKVSIIIIDEFESTHHSLNRFNEVSDFMWIDSHLLESIHVWIVSFLFESSHKTLWLVSNRFIRNLNRINLHHGLTWIDSNLYWVVSFFMLLWFVFLLSESIHASSESIQSVNFVQKLSLITPYYIYISLHITKSIESFAYILSRSQKLIVHTFFKINTFS